MYTDFQSAFNADIHSFKSYIASLSPQNVTTLSSFLTVALDATLLCMTDYGKFQAYIERGLGYANHQYIAECLIEEDAVEQFMLYTSKYPDLFTNPVKLFDNSQMGEQCFRHILNNIDNSRKTYIEIVGKLRIHNYDTMRIIASHPRFKQHPHLSTEDIVSLYGECIVLETVLYHLNLFKVPL